MDQYMTEEAADMRKKTSAMLDDCYDQILTYVDSTEFPVWLPQKFLPLGINGLLIRDYGSPNLSTLEAGALAYEIAKKDVSAYTFFFVHNGLGMAVIEALGDEEQKDRLLPKGINFEKIFSFGLTEPQNGSDASSLKTKATKVKNGWILNGQKRWIGNGTFADVIVWARNMDDGGRVQAFVVEKGSKGMYCNKMKGKLGLRFVQNAEIKLDNCFVPDRNKLTYAKDFGTSTNLILEMSRLMVAWAAAGCMAGAYEAVVKYTIERIQFGKPIAQFQLIQERLSRMLANCEFTIAHLARVSQQFDLGTASPG